MKTEFRKSFTKDLKRQAKDKNLLTHVQKIILEVEAAGDTMKIGNLKKLKAEGSYYRIRVGSYRIGLVIENDTVVFVRILNRGEIYRYFP
jgi:mRNA interferase RelE/StbE